jgi:dTDP-4-dehydrorhamnose reductase
LGTVSSTILNIDEIHAMKILITGSNGLLGQKLVAQLINEKIDFLATSKGENRNNDCPENVYLSLDITNSDEIKKVFHQYQPTHIIHTAAITNVDYCELNSEECSEVNTEAVNKLFYSALEINAHFQLLSTDFVFDGEKGNYKEEDKVGPLSIYAESKVNAERILLESTYMNWSIVRTIIVYGTGNNLSRSNIICWAKEALTAGQNLTIIDDQFRAPTWADDLAWACLEICKRQKIGIFHISGPETISIFEIVERIAKYFSLSTETLNRSKSFDLNQPAKRPPRTGFDLTKAKNDLGYKPHTLEETLDFI